nr:MAG: hypothetical protein [Bacteriophage sp.]
MTATNHTEHYGLSQYVQDDHPTYTGDYNGDMSKIDAAIHAASLSGGTVGLSTVAHDDTLTGDGTTADALSVVGSFRNATRLMKPAASRFDPNDCNDVGVYYVTMNRNDVNVANIPEGLQDSFIRASLVVCKCGVGKIDIAQLWLNRSGGDGEPFIAYRIRGNAWSSWRRLAFVNDIPDVSALTSRIDALESRVSALATVVPPDATGLTATQLDTQYQDDYNIVRIGRPTRSIESEELHHE